MKSKCKQIPKQRKKKLNSLVPRPLGAIRTKRKPMKRLTKKRTSPVKNSQYSQRKYRKKLHFRRQINLPGRSSPVLVSSSDLMRGVNFAFKGKSYKLTLRQMMKVLRRRNLLKKRKIKSKSNLQTFQQKESKERKHLPRFWHQKREGRRRHHESDGLVLGLSQVSGG